MPPIKSDAGWLEDFRARYARWIPEARPLLERHDYSAAFKTYPWPTFTTTPWTPVTRPLADSRIGVVTTGGLYRAGVEAPFASEAAEGDWSFRAIPSDVPIQTLTIAHAHFPHEVAEADMNTIFPLDRLRDLQAAGLIGGLAETHFSVMGYCTRAADLAEGAAPGIAAGLSAAGADVALVVPV
jgi:D-proline reductase (dithiol) PrdB